MNYIKGNKEAWEEAFKNRIDGWGEDISIHIQNKLDYYIQTCIKDVLDKSNLKNKKVAQFCCNNGRELLSISKHYGTKATGFDIAENLIEQGRLHAKALDVPCDFIVTDILEIDEKYNESYDVIVFTIGAITWFKDLNKLFHIVSKCLKKGGIMILQDFHPIMNMMPLPGEESYNDKIAILLDNKYFTEKPWVENNGMGYISGEYNSKTFISFSHSISKIINAIIASGMNISQFNEFDYDIGLSDVYDNKGLPLSMLVVARKEE